MQTKRIQGPPDERFWPKVQEVAPDDLSPNGWAGCWLWTAHCDRNGYGIFGNGSERTTASRWAYRLVVGGIPARMEIDHLCRRRHCVNPAHLELVTRYMNVQRGKDARGLRTHCRRGHDLTGANGYLHGGYRHCRTCRNAAKRARRRRA